MGVIKMANITPRSEIEPTSISMWASVLTITPPRLRNTIILSTRTCLCGSSHERVSTFHVSISLSYIWHIHMYISMRLIYLYTYIDMYVRIIYNFFHQDLRKNMDMSWPSIMVAYSDVFEFLIFSKINTIRYTLSEFEVTSRNYFGKHTNALTP